MTKDNNILDNYWTGSLTGYEVIESKDKYEYKASKIKGEIVQQEVEMISSNNIEVDYSELEIETT